jgi:hypothetical protein
MVDGEGEIMAGPVETISFVARRLIQFEQKFAKTGLSRRRAASQLFSQLSQSVQSLTDDLIRDRLPHDACRELILYSTRIAEGSDEELGPSEAERLAAALGSACDKEKLYLEFRSSDRREYLIEELEKAAILIQALANGIYMAPREENSGETQPSLPAEPTA